MDILFNRVIFWKLQTCMAGVIFLNFQVSPKYFAKATGQNVIIYFCIDTIITIVVVCMNLYMYGLYFF